MAKDKSGPYLTEKRSPTWQKIKRVRESEFVAGGYSFGSTKREMFSGLLLGLYHDRQRLVPTGSVSSQRGEMLRVQGARESHELRDLEIPQSFVYVPAGFPRADPFNVGQMYTLFAEEIRTGQSRLPTFDSPVDLHRFVDAIKQASDTGWELPVA